MNRQEFLRQLESLLYSIPANERADALAYYNDYFDEAGVENEQNVIQELGSPQKVAQSIIENFRNSGYEQPYENTTGKYSQNAYQNYQHTEKKKLKTWQIVLLVILAIVGSPIWIGLAMGLFGALIGIIAGVFAAIVSLFGSGLGLVLGGIAVAVVGGLGVMVRPLESVTCMGVGLLLTAIGILLTLLAVLITFAWLPKLIKIIVKWVKGLFHRNEGGNEI